MGEGSLGQRIDEMEMTMDEQTVAKELEAAQHALLLQHEAACIYLQNVTRDKANGGAGG